MQRMDALPSQLFVEAAASAAQPVRVFALGEWPPSGVPSPDIDVLILFAGPLWPIRALLHTLEPAGGHRLTVGIT
jgi:hypothetical protein